MSTAEIKRKAREFLIWREGTAVNWDCSTYELAKATKIPQGTVHRICKERDWHPRRSEERAAERGCEQLAAINRDRRDRELAEDEVDLVDLLT